MIDPRLAEVVDLNPAALLPINQPPIDLKAEMADLLPDADDVEDTVLEVAV